MKETISIKAEWVCSIFRLDDGSLVINGENYTFSQKGTSDEELIKILSEIRKRLTKEKL